MADFFFIVVIEYNSVRNECHAGTKKNQYKHNYILCPGQSGCTVCSVVAFDCQSKMWQSTNESQED